MQDIVDYSKVVWASAKAVIDADFKAYTYEFFEMSIHNTSTKLD